MYKSCGKCFRNSDRASGALAGRPGIRGSELEPNLRLRRTGGGLE